MKYFSYFLGISLLGFFVWSCTQPPEYPIEPVIDFVNLSKSEMKQGRFGEDTTYVTISFTDGDGDIGHFKEGSQQVEADLFLTDLRTTAQSEQFSVWFIPELGSSNGISGEITFRLLTTCCIYPPNSNFEPCEPSAVYPVDTLVYEIYLVDRAGNESNRIQTDPIFLQCQF